MSYPPQPGQYGPQPGWGQSPQDGSQDFWRNVAAGGGQQPPFPPGPPKKSNTGLIIGLAAGGVGLVLVVVLVLVFTLGGNSDNQAGEEHGGGSPTTSQTRPTTSKTTTSTTSATDIGTGDCVDLHDEGGGRITKESCGNAESDYEIVEVLARADRDGCPKNYSNTYEGTTYCMVLDVKVGDCLTRFNDAEDVLPLKADCADPTTEDQVTKVEPSPAPEGVCLPEEGWYSFEDPALTVCFGDVKRGA
ncbi:hypothetical protein [Saccharopolyspora taberi]|uniref:Uncharacterized protein n=1 Tax=Saccharopolyspora taberi TaxID=60895 RepID=A0ABN3VNR8_9PSEU